MTTTNFCGTLVFEKDHEIGTRRPDFVITDKKDKSCKIIVMAIREDGQVREKGR